MATSAPNTPLKDPALGPSFTDAEGDESWAKHASHSEVISTNSRASQAPTPQRRACTLVWTVRFVTPLNVVPVRLSLRF